MVCLIICLHNSLAPLLQGNGRDKENVRVCLCVSYDLNYVMKTHKYRNKHTN